MHANLWIVVLIKDFSTAKSRLAPVMQPAQRRALAEMTAARALHAALAVAPTLAVCGSPEAADLARAKGAELVEESHPGGQNPAARLGLDEVSRRGALAGLGLRCALSLGEGGAARQ